MTPLQRLEEIEKRVNNASLDCGCIRGDAHWLIAEVRRLRELVEQLAEQQAMPDDFWVHELNSDAKRERDGEGEA